MEPFLRYINDRIWDEEKQSFVAVLSGEETDVDACLLLLSELGFVDAMDPKYVATVDVIDTITTSITITILIPLSMIFQRIGKVLKKGDFLFRYVEEVRTPCHYLLILSPTPCPKFCIDPGRLWIP